MNTTEKLVGALSNKELKDLIIAYKRYSVERGVDGYTLINKLCEAYVKSCELESEIINPFTLRKETRIGVAEYKLAEAAGHY